LCFRLRTIGEIKCDICAPGYYKITNSKNDALICKSCPAGFFSTTGASCTMCPVGTSAAIGAALCTTCVPGKTSNGAASDCTRCPSGYFAHSAIGKIVCKPCLSGTYLAGASKCTTCVSGSFSRSGASTSDTFSGS
jgi:hypothetical protein